MATTLEAGRATMARAAAPVSALLTFCLLGAPAPLSAQTEAPDVTLSLQIDTDTGAFTAQARLEAPVGEVTLPRADWLTVERVELTSGDSVAALRQGRATLGPAHHRNRDLSVFLSGHLPPPRAPLSFVAWDSAATYAVGPGWFPVDEAGIRDHALTVTLDADQKVAATGSLLSDTVTGATRETRYLFTGRSEDLGLFLGPYVQAEASHRGRALRTFFEEGDAALSERYFAAIGQYLDRYEQEIGPYPYDGFSVVSAPIPVGLGFAGLTYVSRDILAHPYMTGRSLAHEVLHSWWGNAVGVDYSSGNWAEGLTTYQADYALAADRGASAAREMRVGWIRALAGRPAEEAQALAAFRSSSHEGDQSEGYGKAALVFHMLRAEVGPSTFAAAIKAFYRDNRNRIASWSDLRAAFEASAGRDLGWFFDQWITRAGLPRIEITSATLREEADGYVASLSFRQAFPAYRLRLPLMLEMATGTERRVVEVSGAEDRVEIALGAAPHAVRLDPDFEIARLPLDGELAPILSAAASGGALLAVAASPLGPEGAAIAAALAPVTGQETLAWQEAAALRGVEAPVRLIAGTPGAVAAMRPAHLGPVPDVSKAGATRIWIERDGDGALWVFLTFEVRGEIAQDLRALRYYTGQSYLAFAGGRAVESGVWQSAAGAGRVAFTAAAD